MMRLATNILQIIVLKLSFFEAHFKLDFCYDKLVVLWLSRDLEDHM